VGAGVGAGVDPASQERGLVGEDPVDSGVEELVHHGGVLGGPGLDLATGRVRLGDDAGVGLHVRGDGDRWSRAEQDVLVYEEADPRFWMGVGVSRDDRWIMIGIGSKTSSEILALLRDSVSSLGQTTVMVTHDARAAAIADRVVFLSDGLIVADRGKMTSDEILDQIKSLE